MVDLREEAPLPTSPVPAGFLDRVRTLTQAFAALADSWPDWEGMCVLDRDRKERRFTIGMLWGRATTIATALGARGVTTGDVVLLVLPTGPEIVSAYFGVLLAGGIPGLVATPSNRLGNRRVYSARVRAILANAGARALYCDAEVAGLFRDDPALLEDAVLICPSDATATRDPVLMPSIDGAGLATVQYSSGSTGVPKGILLTHEAMLNNIRAVRDGLGMTPSDPSLNWIPLYHDMGLIDAFLLPLLNGSPTILIPTLDFMREPALWLWGVHRYRGALSWAPNFAYAFCANRISDDELTGLDLSSWRIAINAAEPVLAPTLRAFTTRFAAHGFRPEAMTPAWGLAENVTIATAHPIGVVPRVETIERHTLVTHGLAQPTEGDGLASVAIGRCLPHCEVEIRDAEQCSLPERHVGTIWLRTNSLFQGYLRDPEETSRVLVEGWLDTGDEGYVAEGDLHFISRNKDVIVIGGEKIPPHDVESAINGVPGVRKGCAVVFGVPNEERGTEEMAAVVETRVTGGTEQAALKLGIREAVTRDTGLALRHLLLVEPGGIEKTSSGKLARQATRRRWVDQLATSTRAASHRGLAAK
jgi:fatty-acyl-CoA synthase